MHLIVTETSNFVHILVHEKQHQIWTLIFDLDKLAKVQNFWNNNYGNLPKHAWILCIRHNLSLAELCALRARCLLFQMLSIIVSTPSGSFKADRLYLFDIDLLTLLSNPDFLSKNEDSKYKEILMGFVGFWMRRDPYHLCPGTVDGLGKYLIPLAEPSLCYLLLIKGLIRNFIKFNKAL